MYEDDINPCECFEDKMCAYCENLEYVDNLGREEYEQI